MNPITFNIIPGTDREYYSALEAMRSEGAFAYEKATFGHLPAKSPNELASDADFQSILQEDMRVFQHMSFKFGDRLSVSIQRQPDDKSLFDKVSVNPPDNADQVLIAKLTTSLQKKLGQTSLLNVGNLLGPAATQHFEAREIALARLEKLAANLLGEMEESRKRRDAELEEKALRLEEESQRRLSELDAASKSHQEEIDQRSVELDARSKELDDRAAKHARRQHYKDIKERFNSWSDTFNVTRGTTRLRWHVYAFTILLLLLFGVAAAYFLIQSINAQDTTHFIVAVVKQITLTLLFVSTAFFFIRWNNEWFQRHANEEFHLKRMELDVDRASWFVEMAFEWKEEKGEEIPLELIDRLTANLFSLEGDEKPTEPHDAFAQALGGAARFKVKLTDGTEVEYDRKGVQRLFRERGTP